MKPINKLFLSAALLCGGSVALAGEPIAAVDVKLGKNPGGSVAEVQSDANGYYQFSKLAPGKYEVCIARQACKTVDVGKDGVVKGRVEKPVNGPAKAKAGELPALQEVSTTR